MDPSARVVGVGAVQAPVTADARAPGEGRGAQQGRKVEARSGETFLHLVVQLTEGQGGELVTASELPGKAVLGDGVSGTYVYEVSSGSKTLAVETLVDPFESRSFPRSGEEHAHHREGHSFERNKTATLAVRVPGMTLQRAAEQDVAFTLYELKTEVAAMNPEVLRQLKQQGKVERKLEIPGRKLGAEIAAKGKRVDP